MTVGLTGTGFTAMLKAGNKNSTMDNDNTFPLSLDFEGKHYSGRITPSEEKGEKGMPVFFRVTIGGELFAYLCCSDKGWKEKDGSVRSDGLVSAIGNYIVDFYE